MSTPDTTDQPAQPPTVLPPQDYATVIAFMNDLARAAGDEDRVIEAMRDWHTGDTEAFGALATLALVVSYGRAFIPVPLDRTPQEAS